MMIPIGLCLVSVVHSPSWIFQLPVRILVLVLYSGTCNFHGTTVEHGPRKVTVLEMQEHFKFDFVGSSGVCKSTAVLQQTTCNLA